VTAVTAPPTHACARCGQPAAVALGAMCPACVQFVERRAVRWARWVALGSTAIVVAYLVVTLRRVPATLQGTGRAIAATATLAWGLVTYRIVKRVGLEWRG